ncbi:right-handed parallel beta-helix repeat-containing protein [Demequina aestuarii]|uniref:right-handed parallel beta-helix repeat-containing protein n=1 Tax=Demequina aestuarii TaxID=327095 RepID=UPI00187C26DE|nr:right-handed parallel beta-helix repeat-containing protein [Demequina aestuarii]
MATRPFSVAALIAVAAAGLTLVSATTASAATLTVDDDGPADFASISAAVAAATPGDVVTVAAGSYTEDVTVDKQLSIVGDGAGTTSVVGDWLLSAPTSISGFALSGGDRVIQAGAGAEGSQITENSFDGGGTSGQGVFIDSVVGGDATVVSNNVFDGFDVDGFSAVWVYKSAAIEVTGNTITSNGTGGGVNVGEGSDDVSITGNTFNSVQNALVLIAIGQALTDGPSSNVTFSDNTVTSSSSSAVYVGGNNVTGLTIDGNSFGTIGRHAVQFTAGYTGNESAWIAPSGPDLTEIVISGNSITSANIGIAVGDGVLLAEEGSITSTGNTFGTMSSGFAVQSLATTEPALVSDEDNLGENAASGNVIVNAAPEPEPTVTPEPSTTPEPTAPVDAEAQGSGDGDELAESGAADVSLGAAATAVALLALGLGLVIAGRRTRRDSPTE